MVVSDVQEEELTPGQPVAILDDMTKKRKKKSKRKSPAGPKLKRMQNGRPLLLTDAVHEKAVGMFGRGGFLENIAASCGVTSEAMRVWMRLGAKAQLKVQEGADLEGNDVRYFCFFVDVERARADGIDQCLDGVAEISEQNDDMKVRFSALKYRLAVADSRYSERNRTELSGPGGQPVVIEVAGTIGEAIKRARKAMPNMADDDE